MLDLGWGLVLFEGTPSLSPVMNRVIVRFPFITMCSTILKSGRRTERTGAKKVHIIFFFHYPLLSILSLHWDKGLNTYFQTPPP